MAINDVNYVKAVLDELAMLHAKLRRRVDFSQQNRQHAIYLIQGGCLTNAYIGVDCYERGYQNHVMQTVRFLFESRALADFLSKMSDTDRRLKAWFEGSIVKVEFGKGRAPKLELLGPRPEDRADLPEWMGAAQKTLYAEYSKSQHPTIDALRFNSDGVTHEFNYDCSALAQQPIRNMPIEQGLLMPTLQVIWGHHRLVPLTKVEFESLREAIRQTEIRHAGKSSLPPRLHPTKSR